MCFVNKLLIFSWLNFKLFSFYHIVTLTVSVEATKSVFAQWCMGNTSTSQIKYDELI